ncbi:hypothetical protein AMELA_G00174050 [Ameiurus melas]|uniref:Uncharacterized protein n=1 Tax=Ameiurus melas TaxID=219545 RepID=A0A7J6ACV8_AMEME|nr:hypothetical protein AMELA_G00174050 [Ameiurus melas]
MIRKKEGTFRFRYITAWTSVGAVDFRKAGDSNKLTRTPQSDRLSAVRDQEDLVFSSPCEIVLFYGADQRRHGSGGVSDAGGANSVLSP